MKTRTVFVGGANSLCLTIPPKVRYALGIVPGTQMDVECIDGKIIYTPVTETLKPYAEVCPE